MTVRRLLCGEHCINLLRCCNKYAFIQSNLQYLWYTVYEFIGFGEKRYILNWDLFNLFKNKLIFYPNCRPVSLCFM